MGNDAKTIESVRQSIELQLKQHKQKSFELEFKKKLEELAAAESLFFIKKSEIENMQSENENLYQ